MVLKLKPRSYMAQPKSYLIGKEFGKADYDLSGAMAPSIPLKNILDPMDLIAGHSHEGGPPTSVETELGSIIKENIIKGQELKNVSPENIILTNGTYEANFIALCQSVDKGDEIIISIPTWYQFAAYMPSEKEYSFCCGGLHPSSKVHLLRREEKLGWRYDIEQLKDLVNPKTALIVIVSPNNPTGKITSEKDMKAICEIAETYGTYVLHDQIYRGLELDQPFSTPLAIDFYDKAICTNSLSKSIGYEHATRIGWLITRDKKMYQRSNTLTGWFKGGEHGWVEEYIVSKALQKDKYREFCKRGVEYANKAWSLVSKFMEKNEDIFDWVKPDAAFLSFPKYNLNINSWELCEKLKAPPYKTRIIPGIAYGYEKHLRLGVGNQSLDQIEKGLNNLGKLIENLHN